MNNDSNDSNTNPMLFGSWWRISNFRSNGAFGTGQIGEGVYDKQKEYRLFEAIESEMLVKLLHPPYVN